MARYTLEEVASHFLPPDAFTLPLCDAHQQIFYISTLEWVSLKPDRMITQLIALKQRLQQLGTDYA